jgi:hypothetical protein
MSGAALTSTSLMPFRSSCGYQPSGSDLPSAERKSNVALLPGKPRPLAWAAALGVLVLGLALPCPAQLSKGYQILLNRGLQLQGLVNWDDYIHLDTYSNASYSSINWGWTSSPDMLAATAGFPWSRWVSDASNMPPQNGEGPYLNQLIALQLGDEWDLNTDSVRTNLINWFASVRSNWPNTILFHNNWAGQVLDAQLSDFIANAHPDLLCFDGYPWQCDYSTRIPLGGPPTNWYSELRRYRAWGHSYGLPFGIYRQTFHSVQDYNSTVYRNPSPSELRLQTSAALAFNAKFMTDFTYNSGATTLFDILPNGYSGDLYTNAMYLEEADANRRAANLGKALMCLKPLLEMHNPLDINPPPGPASSDTTFPDGIVTSMMFLRGRQLVSAGVTNATALPNSFKIDPQASTNPNNPANLMYSWWELGTNDAYLAGWAVTNKAAVKNNGLPGEVILSWFTPLDESFDGPNYTNEVYMMVVNALTDTNGTAADCMQEVRLNFLNNFSSVVMLDPETGQLQTNTLPIVSTRRQLVLDLNGGDAALFKFADGAPFVGHITPQPARLAVALQGGKPAVSLTQLTPGARYQLQSTPTLDGANWTVLTSLLLTNSNYVYPDTGASNTMFYRAVGIP